MATPGWFSTVIFDSLARFSSLGGSEDAGYLISLGGSNVDVAGLVLAAVIGRRIPGAPEVTPYRRAPGWD